MDVLTVILLLILAMAAYFYIVNERENRDVENRRQQLGGTQRDEKRKERGDDKNKKKMRPLVYENLNLLLMGKTGAGKSATGNSILGRKTFQSAGNFSSQTVMSRKDVAELDEGYRVHLVDTPGVADTKFSDDDGKKMFVRAINEAVAICPSGYDALLLTIRFGERMTEETVDVIRFIKRVFGDQFLAKYGIIVVTYGDNFQDNDEEDCTFVEWCQTQTGHFKNIYDEMNGRVVLFNNRGSAEVMHEQRQQLLEMVVQIKAASGRYTNSMFDQAKKSMEQETRERVYARDDVMDEMGFILSLLERVAAKDGWNFGEDRIYNFERMLAMIYSIKERIEQAKGKMAGKVHEEKMQAILQKMEDKIKRVVELVKAVLKNTLEQAQADKWMATINNEIKSLIKEVEELRQEMVSNWIKRIVDRITKSRVERTVFGLINT